VRVFGRDPVIELRQFRYFVAVAEERHFGRAAQRLGIAQSPLSQAIAQIETVLEVRLLERTSRSVELTPAGEAFLVASRETLAEAQRAVDAVGAAGARETDPVHIAATPVTALMIVPAVGAELARRTPEREVEVVALQQIGILAALAGFEADIGFATHPLPPAGLTAEVVRREPAVVVVGPRNPLAKRRSVPLAAVVRQPLVIWPRELAPGYHDRLVAIVGQAAGAPRLALHSAAGPDWGGEFAEEGFTLVPRGAPRIPDAVHLELTDPPVLETYVLWRAGDERRRVTEAVEAARMCARARSWLNGV
jgi:DNA-binding transcriptional LysR family regulator